MSEPHPHLSLSVEIRLVSWTADRNGDPARALNQLQSSADDVDFIDTL